MKLLLSAYKEGEGQQGQQNRLSLQHAESPEVAWGERRASERLVPKQYEAAEPAEVAGSLQLALFSPKMECFHLCLSTARFSCNSLKRNILAEERATRASGSGFTTWKSPYLWKAKEEL